MRRKKLSIGIIQQSPDIGGAETFMIALMKELISRENNIVYAGNAGKFYKEVAKLNIQSTKVPIILDVIGNYKGFIKSIILLPYAVIFYLRLLNKFKDLNIDVILMSGFSEKMLVSFLSIFFKIPVVWIEYGPLSQIFNKNLRLPKVIYQGLISIPKKIIVPSINTKKDLIKNLNKIENKITQVPCGIRFFKIKKSKYPKWKDKIIVGNISRLTREKGQQYLIKSIPLIIRKHPEARFLFVGSGPDKDYFINYAKKLGVDKYLDFVGFVDNVNKYYSYFDIFVFPTVWELEGFGLVAVEAMSAKVPVIGNDHNSLKEILGNNGGILVDIKNDKKVSTEIRKLLKSRSLRQKVGIMGFEKAKLEYDISKTSEKYEQLLVEAIR